jgi:hypothetical protein
MRSVKMTLPLRISRFGGGGSTHFGFSSSGLGPKGLGFEAFSLEGTERLRAGPYLVKLAETRCIRVAEKHLFKRVS